MKLYYQNKPISESVRLLKSLFTQAHGLMFRKTVPKPYIFVFNKEKYEALHMFCVFTPIDALFLNKNKEIIEIKENLKPFSHHFPKKKSKYIIELAPNSVKKYNIKLNTSVGWK